MPINPLHWCVVCCSNTLPSILVEVEHKGRCRPDAFLEGSNRSNICIIASFLLSITISISRIFLCCLKIFFCITENISVLADGARKNVIGVFRPSPVCLLSPQWAPPPPSPLPRSPSHPLPCYLPFLVLPFNLLSQTLIGQCALCFVHNMYFVFSTF